MPSGGAVGVQPAHVYHVPLPCFPLSQVPNVILFCERCDIGVHQQCYGVAQVPPGDEEWLCWPCREHEQALAFQGMPRSQLRPPRWQRGEQPLEGGSNSVPCALCPVQRGAFLRTADGTQWVHVVCGRYQPELTVTPRHGDPAAVAGIDSIKPDRFAHPCEICGEQKGAVVPCSFGHCQSYFHPLCARNAELYMPVRDGQGGRVHYRIYCGRHGSIQRAKDDANPVAGLAAERKVAHDRAMQALQAKERDYETLYSIRLELESVRIMLERICKRVPAA